MVKNEPLKLNTLKNKVKEIMRSIKELEREGKIDEKSSKELNCTMGQLGYGLDWSVKSAVQGLLEEIDELIEWYEKNRKEDYRIFTAKRDTAFRIKNKIKKWFPIKEEEV